MSDHFCKLVMGALIVLTVAIWFAAMYVLRPNATTDDKDIV